MSHMNNLLDGISQDVKQKIFECISQAIGEDRQEADAHLELRTHVSGPFLNWDLIYRNLMNSFGNENVKYSLLYVVCGLYYFYMMLKAACCFLL